MTGPPREHHLGSKPGREIFLTSSSLSFSSFSSSCASSDDDAIEINMEASPTSCGEEDQQGTLLKASSGGSEMSCLTHVTMQPAPSPPSKFAPYDPERIPASVFGKKAKDLSWSGESLFSLRMSNYEAFRQSNLMPEDVLMMPGEFLAYSPSLKVKSEDAEEEITQVMKKKRTSVEETNNIHREKSLSSPNPPPAYSYPSSFAQLYQAPPSNKVQSISLPVKEKKSKKTRKMTRKNNKNEKKNNNKCCSICSWLFSGFSKCKCCFCFCCK